MINRTREDEWRAVMATWLESKMALDSSTIFSDDEYGLLNAAKFAIHEFTWNANQSERSLFAEASDPDGNGSAVVIDGLNVSRNLEYLSRAEVIAKSPSMYSLAAIVILSVIITTMMIVIVVGNMLVVIAIATENNLTTVQNWFIASLAVADMLIGLVIMPFSLSYELMGYWMFGAIWCEIHAAMDVFMCTSSIMNICLISLDRYWSITKAISYLNQRTPTRVAIMIWLVWIMSALISIPPLLGWKKDVDLDWLWALLTEQGNRTQLEFLQDLEESGRIDLTNFTQTLETVVYPQCTLSQDLGYVMYSAFGSFYIPSCIMVFVYIKIYYAARERARRVINKPGFSKRISRRFAKANSATAASSAAGAASVPPANRKANIATISNPNGCINNSPSNNTTVGNSEGLQLPMPPAAPVASASATTEAKKKVEKKTRFDIEASESMGEDDAFLPNDQQPMNSKLALSTMDPKKKRLVHILSATSVEAPSGRPSDPEVTIANKPHAYGACATNGGHLRTRRSVGVSTKDDDDANVMESNKSTQLSSAAAPASKMNEVKCLKFRLRSKFKNTTGRRPSKETREVIDMGKLSAASAATKKRSPLNGILRKMESRTSMLTSSEAATIVHSSNVPNNNPVSSGASPSGPPACPKLTPEQEADKEKKRIARKKERRATLILGLIMGSFIACWFPFFFLYSISPICPICETSPEAACCVQGWGFTFAFWLGYSNSALNPVIYTVFNKDFRRAFKRILFK